MSVKCNDEFKQQAVQKLLNRGEGVTITDIVTPLGVSMSAINTLQINSVLFSSGSHFSHGLAAIYR